MSGGVDSSVAAVLLKQQGYRVTGLFAQSWDDKEETGECSADEDWRDVQQVCQQLDMPCVRTSFVERYWTDVFEPLVDAYSSGLTPNPDVDCNRVLKFSEMRQYALDTLQGDYFATGHYARLDDEGRLFTSPSDKDQTLFLCQVNCKQFQQVLFPIGHLNKQQVRELAQQHHLHTASKKSSSGICFVGKRKFGEFIENYMDLTPGPFVDIATNQIIGMHNGVQRYTVGQRARAGGLKEKMYIVSKDISSATVWLAPQRDPRLLSHFVYATQVSWVKEVAPMNMLLQCRYRHGAPLVDCSVQQIDQDNIKVQFESPQKTPAPGQIIAIYKGDCCMGGAMISQTEQVKV